MPVSNGAELNIIYPTPFHPDLTVLWSIDGRMYFTNNDYRNVYELAPLVDPKTSTFTFESASVQR